jgi:hypothetical protein
MIRGCGRIEMVYTSPFRIVSKAATSLKEEGAGSLMVSLVVINENQERFVNSYHLLATAR